MQEEQLRELNEKYAVEDALRFERGLGDVVVARLRNDHGEAAVCVYAGHVMEYVPRGGRPVLWISPTARFREGTAIRGGIPVCWPWFGAHPEDSSQPSHGFARTMPWEVDGTGQDDAEVWVQLRLTDSEATRSRWPHAFRLELRVTLSDALEVALIAHNTGHESFTCTGALHSYFAVEDVASVRIDGLDGCTYLDSVDGMKEKVQEGSILVRREVDRIYVDTDDTCSIHDPNAGRTIVVEKEGSLSTVVWNPWIDKAQRLSDFPDDAYHRMVCVETANAAGDTITVAPGESHRLVARLREE